MPSLYTEVATHDDVVVDDDDDGDVNDDVDDSHDCHLRHHLAISIHGSRHSLILTMLMMIAMRSVKEDLTKKEKMQSIFSRINIFWGKKRIQRLWWILLVKSIVS